MTTENIELSVSAKTILWPVAPDGESYIFKKDYLIDPEKPDEIYSDFRMMRG